jgi:hypothetical protein
MFACAWSIHFCRRARLDDPLGPRPERVASVRSRRNAIDLASDRHILEVGDHHLVPQAELQLGDDC